MIVGVMQVELLIHDAMTLKDKRRVVKSIKDRVGNEFNVSIAEVDGHEMRRRAILGISLVGNESDYVRTSLDRIVNRLGRCRGASVVDYQIDLI